MTPSNRHPGTVVPGLRRAFLLQALGGLLTALIVAPAPAPAQGVIQFSLGVGTGSRYRVNDDGTGLQSFAFPTASDMIIASTRSDHPGGRQYLYVSATPSGALMAWSEGTGQSKAVASFPTAPFIYAGAFRWSNDGLDSFVSFTVVNGTTGWTYRAHVSAADIASPSFLPITSRSDPRLELVCNFALIHNWWSHDGSTLFYVDPRGGKENLIRASAVGFVSNTPDDDPVVFTASGRLVQLRVVTPGDPLDPNPDRYLAAGSGNGILAIDLQNPLNPQWLATGGGTGFTNIRSPVFSPDGSTIAFGASRTVTVTVGKKKTTKTYHGVYEVPFFGGPITRVTELEGSSSSMVTTYNWNTP